MEADPTKISTAERAQIDDWVDQTVAIKNERVRNVGVGIYMIDRAPLDLFAFIPPEERKERVQRVRDSVREKTPDEGLIRGHVILLRGDKRELSLRCILRHVSVSEDRINDEDLMHLKIYKSHGGRGVTVLDTRGKTPHEVAKEIMRTVSSTATSMSFRLTIVSIKSSSAPLDS